MREFKSIDEVKNAALEVVKSATQTHEQQIMNLAGIAQDSIPFVEGGGR